MQIPGRKTREALLKKLKGELKKDGRGRELAGEALDNDTLKVIIELLIHDAERNAMNIDLEQDKRTYNAGIAQGLELLKETLRGIIKDEANAIEEDFDKFSSV